jgi:hypothetical protein
MQSLEDLVLLGCSSGFHGELWLVHCGRDRVFAKTGEEAAGTLE